MFFRRKHRAPTVAHLAPTSTPIFDRLAFEADEMPSVAVYPVETAAEYLDSLAAELELLALPLATGTLRVSR